MYKVRIKRFADTEQIQVYEKQLVYDTSDLFPQNYLLDSVKDSNASFMENPFNDEKMEWLDRLEEKSAEDRAHSIAVSRSRTINKIYDIARSNVWEWFFTLTFNPEKVDSFDYSVCSKKLSDWLSNMRKKCPDMKYIVVPEKHQSGRYHFHGLFANVSEMDFVDSGKLSGEKVIYNVGNYRLGFSTATRIEDNHRATSYLCKYITKELCTDTFGKKRYWNSRNVELPEVVEFLINSNYEDMLHNLDIGENHCKTIESYLKITYVDKPIYSTNIKWFVENDLGSCLPEDDYWT